MSAGRINLWYRSIATKVINATIGRCDASMCPKQSTYLKYRQLGSTYNRYEGLHHSIVILPAYYDCRCIQIDDTIVSSRVEISDTMAYMMRGPGINCTKVSRI